MTVDELRNLLSQGRRLSEEVVLRGVDDLTGEHMGRLGEDLVSDQLPRVLARARLARRELAAAGGAASEEAIEAVRTDLRRIKAQVALAAAPRETGARVPREFKELMDACLNPLLAAGPEWLARGLDDLVIYLESVASHAVFHHHVFKARKRSEMRRRRLEEQGGPPRRDDHRGERGERGPRGPGGERGDRPRGERPPRGNRHGGRGGPDAGHDGPPPEGQGPDAGGPEGGSGPGGHGPGGHGPDGRGGRRRRFRRHGPPDGPDGHGPEGGAPDGAGFGGDLAPVSDNRPGGPPADAPVAAPPQG